MKLGAVKSQGLAGFYGDMDDHDSTTVSPHRKLINDEPSP